MSRSGLCDRAVVTMSVLSILGSAGCASTQTVKMDPSRPIETEHGYQQDGVDLDRADMVAVLGKDPASSSDVSRAQVLGVTAIVLATAGGALVGWPVGEKLGGKAHPTWELAYAGAAAIAVSIPLALWADGSIGSAVEAHNRATRGPAAGGFDTPGRVQAVPHRFDPHVVNVAGSAPYCSTREPSIELTNPASRNEL